ncbi:hypothetical protein GCM10029964_079830 [Kibdelosporangium lantanae]
MSDLPTTGLGLAMTKIADTPTTSGYVEYGDTANLRLHQEFTNLRGYGWSPLATAMFQVKDRVGLDPDKVAGAITAGLPPDATGLLTGDFDPATIGARLTAAGGREEKAGDLTKWTLAGDHEINLDSPFADLGIVNQLNKVAAGRSTFAFASTTAGLQATIDPDKSLARNPTLAALSNCLGDVRVAVLAVARQPAPIAAGVRDNPTTDVLCVLAPDGDKAKSWAKTAGDNLDHGRSTRTQQPWNTLLAEGKAEEVTGDRAVRVTAKPRSASVDVLIQAIRNEDTTSLVPTS